MDVTCSEQNSETQTDRHPLLTEQIDGHTEHEHIIDVTSNDDTSSSSSHDDRQPEMNLPQHEDMPPSSVQLSTHQTSSSLPNRETSRNSTITRRSDGYSHRRRSPLNSGLWISIESLVTVGQIIASIIVLSMSRNETPESPLFIWVVGYACGCVATLPILYWRFHNRNQSAQQDSYPLPQGSSQNNSSDSASYIAISVSHASDEENLHATESAGRNGQTAGHLSSRLNGLMDHFKMALDCFFAVWFVVGNVWIFGGHSTPSDAPKLYKLCIVFLTFSCIGYAMPFILCATICCCLPCIVSLLGFREDFSQTKGATAEYINTLPTYKFKLKNSGSGDDPEDTVVGEGGILAAGTEKERLISGEDAVCCICLNKYVDDDQLRELPCSHVFHVDCVDKWLKINASCPLCKGEVGENSSTSPSLIDSDQQ